MLRLSTIQSDWNNILITMGTQNMQTLEIHTYKKVIHFEKAANLIKEMRNIDKAAGCINTL